MTERDYLTDALTLGNWDPLAPMQGQRTALAWRGLRFALRTLGHLRNEGDTLLSLDQRLWATKQLDNLNEGRAYPTIKHQYAARYIMAQKSIYPIQKWLPHVLEMIGVPLSLIPALASFQNLKPEDEPQPPDLLRFEEELASDLVNYIIESREHDIYEKLNVQVGVTYMDYRDILAVVRNMLLAMRPINPETERVATLMQLEDAIQVAKGNGEAGAMIRAINQKMRLLGFSKTEKGDIDPHRMNNNTQIASTRPPAALIEQLKEKRKKQNA